MEGDFEVACLSELEVDYLLSLFKIRASRKTLAAKRTIAKEVLKGKVLAEVKDPNFDVTKELSTIGTTLKELEALIEDFKAPSSDSMYKTILSRLIFLSCRVNNFQVPEEPEDLKSRMRDFKDDSYALCYELRAKLNDNVVRFDRSSLNLNISQVSAGPSVSQSLNLASSVSVPVYKWGLTFDGTSSIKAFLERVNEMSISRNVSEDQLFNSCFDLFEGVALTWYRANRDSFLSWGDIVSALKKDFLPPYYDEALLDQIKARCQGRNESVTIFVSIMQNLFSKLSEPPAKKDQLLIIRRNLLTRYVHALALQDVNDISQLVNLCKRFDEATQYNSKNFNLKTDCLEADLALVNLSQTSTRGPSQDKGGPHNNSNIKNSLTCWNCSKKGHAYMQCREQKKKFCFKCGKPNFTTYTCPSCKAKN